MKKVFSPAYLLGILLSFSCNNPDMNKPQEKPVPVFKKGEFGYDLQFLRQQDSSLILLKSGDAQVIVSPRYQGKVFTSTATGEQGYSFGWIHYAAFEKLDAHMNAYGGENRLWLGPEGGKFSLFFKPDSSMVIENWKTPAPVDTESWNLKSSDSNSVSMTKDMVLENYAGSTLRLSILRTIKILERKEIMERMGLAADDTVHVVAYDTENTLTNTGNQEWTASTGMPCIWMLDMLKPSPSTVVIVPFQKTDTKDFAKVATTNYFGEIPSDRISHTDSLLVFKADGKSRGKLGIAAGKASKMAGSYDAENKVLTIILFDVDGKAKYLNQEWNITKPSFAGDAVNAYNDGPLANGTQMGPFYEIESVSPAAFLKPNASLSHRHAVFHFTGNEKTMDKIAIRFLGISLEKINKSFSDEKSN